MLPGLVMQRFESEKFKLDTVSKGKANGAH